MILTKNYFNGYSLLDKQTLIKDRPYYAKQDMIINHPCNSEDKQALVKFIQKEVDNLIDNNLLSNAFKDYEIVLNPETDEEVLIELEKFNLIAKHKIKFSVVKSKKLN